MIRAVDPAPGGAGQPSTCEAVPTTTVPSALTPTAQFAKQPFNGTAEALSWWTADPAKRLAVAECVAGALPDDDSAVGIDRRGHAARRGVSLLQVLSASAPMPTWSRQSSETPVWVLP